MCKDCCGGMHLPLSTTASDQLTATPGWKPSADVFYHAAVLLTPTPFTFPGTPFQIDVYHANRQLLLSSILSGGLSEHRHNICSDPPWPPRSTLLRHAVALAPSPTERYGTLAVFPDNAPCTQKFFTHTRFTLHVIGRYERVGDWQVHNPHLCIVLRLICDQPTPTLYEPIDIAFPPINTPRTSLRVQTRSQTSAMAKRQRRRSFAHMGGLSYVSWHANQPQQLLQRTREAMETARIALRPPQALERPLFQCMPQPHHCPTRWSLWLCRAALIICGPNVMGKYWPSLLRTTSVVERLRRLLVMFQEALRNDKAFSLTPRRKRKHITSPEPRSVKRLKTNQRHESHQVVPMIREDSVTKMLTERPWPSSENGGFASVDIRFPSKGRFQFLRPSALKPVDGALGTGRVEDCSDTDSRGNSDAKTLIAPVS